MERHEFSNIQAIKDCTELIQSYSIEECLAAADNMCKALDDGSFVDLIREKNKDSCLQEVFVLVTAKWGARNVLAALLYLQGDTEGHQLHLAAYRYAAERATKEINKLFD